MKLKDLINKLKKEYFYTQDDILNAEITDIRTNDNGKWIEFQLNGMTEVINILEKE